MQQVEGACSSGMILFAHHGRLRLILCDPDSGGGLDLCSPAGAAASKAAGDDTGVAAWRREGKEFSIDAAGIGGRLSRSAIVIRGETSKTRTRVDTGGQAWRAAVVHLVHSARVFAACSETRVTARVTAKG